MNETRTKTTHIRRDEDGLVEVIEVETAGDQAYDRAKVLISSMLEDMEQEDITGVRVQLVAAHGDELPAVGDAFGRVNGRGQTDGNAAASSEPASASSSSQDGRSHSDRERKRIRHGTNGHEILHILAEANSREDPITSNEMKNLVQDTKQESVARTLSGLYYAKLADREKHESGHGAYAYWIADWGRRELERLGAYPYDFGPSEDADTA